MKPTQKRSNPFSATNKHQKQSILSPKKKKQNLRHFQAFPFFLPRKKTKAKKRTLFMLCVKTSTETFVAFPIVFVNLLITNKTTGTASPLVAAPMHPKPIRNLSTPSACMKMDRKDPFFFFITSTPFLSLPIFRVVHKKAKSSI